MANHGGKPDSCAVVIAVGVALVSLLTLAVGSTLSLIV